MRVKSLSSPIVGWHLNSLERYKSEVGRKGDYLGFGVILLIICSSESDCYPVGLRPSGFLDAYNDAKRLVYCLWGDTLLQLSR